MPKELLFYDATTGMIATAILDSDGTFIGQKTGTLAEGWTHIVAAGSELLFYRADTGEIATAVLDSAGTFIGQKTGTLAEGWTHIVASDPA